METKNTESAKKTSDIQVLLDEVVSESSNLQSQYKLWHTNVKKLVKEMKREQKKLSKMKPKRIVKQKPQEVSKSMQKFMYKQCNADKSDSYTRQHMMKEVSSYIKKQDLQNSANRKQWKPDSCLKKLFDLNNDYYTFMQINGLISRVVIKKKSP
jgi:chromatin remodeling complex protein RSC6